MARARPKACKEPRYIEVEVVKTTIASFVLRMEPALGSSAPDLQEYLELAMEDAEIDSTNKLIGPKGFDRIPCTIDEETVATTSALKGPAARLQKNGTLVSGVVSGGKGYIVVGPYSRARKLVPRSGVKG